MGLFDLLFGRKRQEAHESQVRGNEAILADDAELDVRQERDYADIVEIARILTNGNEDVIRDFTLLAQDHEAFAAKYADWCDDMLEDRRERDEAMLYVTAYWLVGHDTAYKFGGYIDWKEETEEIMAHLAEAIGNLGYPLDMEKVAFSGEEFTNEALAVIDESFRDAGYTLASLDIGGDCYHLFIVPLADFDRLAHLGAGLDLKFFNNFRE